MKRYLIIGNGRVAKHMQNYFNLLQLDFGYWHRALNLEQLQQELATATHILLLISDKAIEEFILQHLIATTAYRIHFSGSLVSDLAYGAHPLLGFTPNLYDLEKYKSIPFVLDHDAPEFSEILPHLTNPHEYLDKALKPKYHALCVMAGNFSCMLWQKLFTDFSEEFAFSSKIAFPYLQQQTQNLLLDAKNALTGPLVRNDNITIQKNLTALTGDPFAQIYQSFVTCYQQLNKTEHSI